MDGIEASDHPAHPLFRLYNPCGETGAPRFNTGCISRIHIASVRWWTLLRLHRIIVAGPVAPLDLRIGAARAQPL